MNRYQEQYTATFPSSGETDLSIYNNEDLYGFTGPLSLLALLGFEERETLQRKFLIDKKLIVSHNRLCRTSDFPEVEVTKTMWVLPLDAKLKS